MHLHDALRDLRIEGRVQVQPPLSTRGGRPITLVAAVSADALTCKTAPEGTFGFVTAGLVQAGSQLGWF